MTEFNSIKDLRDTCLEDDARISQVLRENDSLRETCEKHETGNPSINEGSSDTNDTHKSSIGNNLSLIKVCTIFAIFAVGLAIIDRLTKAWAVANTAVGLDFIPGFMSFFLVYNKGASFGSLQGATVFLIAISCLICVAILIYLLKYKKHRVYEVIGLSAIFAGAIGNAYDRASAGQVTDFLQLDFMHFPVFNVADCCITAGAILFFIFLLFDKNSPFAMHDKDNNNDAKSTNSCETKGGE